MKITAIYQGHPMWDRVIDFAAGCSWKAGPILALKMRNNNFKSWERVIVATGGGSIMGYCTLTEKDELPAEFDFAPFIGFVFVDEKYRGRRISGKMIECASNNARELGYHKIYIMSGEVGLYEKYGFKKYGDYTTIHGTTDQLFEKEL